MAQGFPWRLCNHGNQLENFSEIPCRTLKRNQLYVDLLIQRIRKEGSKGEIGRLYQEDYSGRETETITLGHIPGTVNSMPKV